MDGAPKIYKKLYYGRGTTRLAYPGPIVWHYLHDPTFSRFDTIPDCDRHTHTHTHRQTDRHTTTAYTALSKASRGKNVSHDVTTPLSGTVCRPSAGTSYDQPVHKIWSLYVYSLRRYKRRRKMQKLGWFGGLGVIQGRRKHSHSIEHIRLFDYSTLIEAMRLFSIV